MSADRSLCSHERCLSYALRQEGMCAKHGCTKCGCAVFADTEDWPAPLCLSCADEICGKYKLTPDESAVYAVCYAPKGHNDKHRGQVVVSWENE